jgi:hypothetical protein
VNGTRSKSSTGNTTLGYSFESLERTRNVKGLPQWNQQAGKQQLECRCRHKLSIFRAVACLLEYILSNKHFPNTVPSRVASLTSNTSFVFLRHRSFAVHSLFNNHCQIHSFRKVYVTYRGPSNVHNGKYGSDERS